MIGITSYGAYIPRLRLNRSAIYQAMGWFAPAIVMVAQGTRSMCNWDEDSITMAVEASRNCLSGISRKQINAMFLASTTLPFADRQNAGIVGTALNLREDIMTSDFTSSQKAGTTALLTALETTKGGDRNHILVTAADKRETRPAGFYEMWFGDGAASFLVGDTNVIAAFKGSHTISRDFTGHYRGARHQFDYTWEERWIRDEGYSKIIPEAINGLFDKLNMTIKDVDKLIYPCFFNAEHKKIAYKLGAGDKAVDHLHDICGETGCAHPFLMMASALDNAKPGERIVLAGFGQGCNAMIFEVTENILKIQERVPFQTTAANKEITDNYFKFLVFRDLIKPDMGIRAEAETQTAMTTLYRNRKMILGLVGGKCSTCDTPQFPKAPVCVNPDCLARHAQEDYKYSEIPARVKTYTGDMLSVTLDPPHVYGMVQFEGGGRFMADFTDCKLEEIKVGLPVRMVFRKKTEDKQRGFVNYFWKATPIPGAEKELASVREFGK